MYILFTFRITFVASMDYLDGAIEYERRQKHSRKYRSKKPSQKTLERKKKSRSVDRKLRNYGILSQCEEKAILDEEEYQEKMLNFDMAIKYYMLNDGRFYYCCVPYNEYDENDFDWYYDDTYAPDTYAEVVNYGEKSQINHIIDFLCDDIRNLVQKYLTLNFYTLPKYEHKWFIDKFRESRFANTPLIEKLLDVYNWQYKYLSSNFNNAIREECMNELINAFDDELPIELTEIIVDMAMSHH